MIIEVVQKKLQPVETDQKIDTVESALKALRGLGLDDFGYFLMSMPNPQFPKLSQLLPRMASEEVQKSWTGNSGEGLLRQTCVFVRSLAYNYAKLLKRTLDGALI